MAQSPRFPEFKELGIEDKATFDEFFKKYPPTISEYTFTNLFIWRHYYRFKWTILNENIVIMAKREETHYFFPPIGEGKTKETILECLSYSESLGFEGIVKRVPESITKLFSSEAVTVKVELDRDNSDYVYLVKNLVDLPGSKYQSKRKSIKQFLRSFPDYEYRPLTKGTISGCLKLQEDWCNIRDCASDPTLAGEDKAIFEGLQHFDKLNFKGALIVVNDKIQAFTMGEQLNADTVVIHIEKGNQEREYRGVYELINKLFLENEWTNFKYVNREQDLGIEGLRKAKVSYNPEFMVNKYTLTKLV